MPGFLNSKSFLNIAGSANLSLTPVFLSMQIWYALSMLMTPFSSVGTSPLLMPRLPICPSSLKLLMRATLPRFWESKLTGHRLLVLSYWLMKEVDDMIIAQYERDKGKVRVEDKCFFLLLPAEVPITRKILHQKRQWVESVYLAVNAWQRTSNSGDRGTRLRLSPLCQCKRPAMNI